VCDRCDSFLCGNCEDMDQCHDCGEVVCQTCCSSLLVCKFCGSSLCEECATACAKCGIVLCGRDAKFAVDCDTCKLSYCLVCLASGQKETCIRCHARPSKRMEQLVHLRLKSIYKAFQQSARTNDAHPHLKRAALAAMKSNAASSKEPKLDPVLAKAQADAAAAELLAELEQEESKQIPKAKKKRKKKKKGKDVVEDKDEDKDDWRTDNVDDDDDSGPSVIQMLDDNDDDDEPDIMELSKKKPNDKKKNKKSAPHVTPAPAVVVEEQPAEAVAMKEEDGQPPLQLDDPMQTKLCELVNAEDVGGIEVLLDEWKGVPGKAALRKNAKKALKRLREGRPKLKIISTTTNASTRETVLEMDPSIVGFVIGKGGQTIRQLMEDSGAKVWIDQSMLETNATRVAYVSGAKKAVDIAVKKIQQLVKEVENPLVIVAEAQEAPVLHTATINNPSADESLPIGWIREDVTCEARFVPLLIGRRGWNIKQIQDASGAKVDINQTVTPRIIYVSGKPESVQTAKRLIQDVLSYPHAQLKGNSSDAVTAMEETATGEIFTAAVPAPTAANDTAAAPGRHTPPPPSPYVMTGDIKSIVSASSSLSSTPEPSSSSKGGRDFVMPPPGLFDNSNRGSNLAQRYAQYSPDQFLQPPQQKQQNFQTMDMQQQALQQQQQQGNNMLLPPMSPAPGHPNMGPGKAGHNNNMPPPRPPMMGKPQGMPHMQQQYPYGLNQPPMQVGGMHMNPGLMSEHQMAMQQQQRMAMARQQQQQQHSDGFMSHGNPNEAGMRFGGIQQRAPPMGAGPQDLGLFGNTNEPRGFFQQGGHNLPPYQHPNDLNNNNDDGILPPGMSSGLRPTKEGSQEESSLIDSLFATTTAGAEASLLAGLQGLNVAVCESGWEAAPGWSQEKSRLPAAATQNESRFQWGS
jgi:transcription antitermination factor NusA-like protein